MRFAVETRTNSIIATGSAGDLELVTAMVIALDENEELWTRRQRKTHVVRLKNASAETVAEAVNQFVADVLEAEQPIDGLLSPAEQMDRQVIIVPEEVTNSLIISSTDWFFDRIVDLVEQLDARQPMVVIQVLIAAVRLNDTDEFGIELGLQDSILFNRSVGGVPGFLFNNAALGNDTTAADSHIVGGQGLGHFDLGRTNDDLGYGGLVISASSEAVSVLIRALKENRRVDVLGRPQIMTVDKVTARILVGQTVRIPSGTDTTQFGTVNLNTTPEDVGLELQVTPRVSSDGQVFMEIVTQRSELGPEEEGTVIAVSATGDAYRSPRIDRAQAETSVTAMSGQTIILGGMITTDRSQVTRKVPWLGDVPVLGHLFRFDSFQEEKTELLIVMTPHIVNSLEEAELVKQVEAARMNWCLNDVLEVHGDIYDRGLQMPVIYPDLEPGAPEIPMAPIPDELQGVRKPANASPFATEPDQNKAMPVPAVPPPDQASGRVRGTALETAGVDRGGFPVARLLPPDAGQPDRPASGTPSGVEPAGYELRAPPPGETTYHR
jgi:type II secretory pathway component GspD/PulD (secretin)